MTYELRPVRDPVLKYWAQLPCDLLRVILQHYYRHGHGYYTRYSMNTVVRLRHAPSRKYVRPDNSCTPLEDSPA